MKKFLMGLMITSILSCSALADNIRLPLPNKLNPTSLMHALNFRHSTKNYSDKEIDNKRLSSLLWAAYGVNRTTGERTIPTAMNHKELSLYVIKKEGAYFYEADTHSLHQIVPTDLRSHFQTQDYMKNVPLVLVWTSTNNEFGALHAGASTQNVGLFTAAHKMGSVVRGAFDKEKIKTELKLNPNETILISMAIGYPVFTEADDQEIPGEAAEPAVQEKAPSPDLPRAKDLLPETGNATPPALNQQTAPTAEINEAPHLPADEAPSLPADEAPSLPAV